MERTDTKNKDCDKETKKREEGIDSVNLYLLTR